MNFQEVILVNEKDEPTGTMEKMEAHRKALLHRAFSVFIFNSRGEMLLQQRAIRKYHSGGLWTNACCSHPQPGEESLAAAHLRLFQEMGFDTSLEPLFEFVYRSDFENGLTEYEYDHVFVGVYDGPVLPNAAEVQDFCYMQPEEIARSLQSHPDKYTSWFQIAFPKVQAWAGHRFPSLTAV